MNPEISVVAPLRNESANVAPLAEQILRAFRDDPRSIEIILVDDGSTDDTWSRILALRTADERIRPLRHSTSRGQSAALWSGFMASRGEIIATLDGDLQNDPADLPRMIGELSRCDMICGVRTKRQDTRLRKISSAIARWARKAVLHAEFRDTGCNLRAFKRQVLATLPAFDGIHRFMPILAQGGGACVLETPVNHHPRTAGQTKYGVWNRLGRGIFDLLVVRWYLKRQIKTMSPAESPADSDASFRGENKQKNSVKIS
jgi:dolichol-phosphate mannosyltransferase